MNLISRKKIGIALTILIGTVIYAANTHSRIISTYGSYENRSSIRKTLERKKTHLRNPGFEKQLYAEKYGEGNEVPYGLMQKWMDHDAELRSLQQQNSPFESIEELGPASVGGRTRAIHIDPTNPNHILAGGISGGIWVSEDRGLNWSVINDNASNLTVSSITYNPLNPNIIYYSTGEARGGGGIGEGIFKSIDNGQSFEVLPSSLEIAEFRYSWKITHSLTDSNTIFAGTYRGLFRSLNGGTSWERVLDVNGKDVNDVLAFDDGTILAAVEETGLYRSPTGDPGTFVQVDTSYFPFEYSRIKIAYCATQQNFIYAMFAVDIASAVAPKIYRSTDRGLTWEKKSTPVISGTQRRYNMMLGVHPTNPAKVVCGTVLSNYSENGGATWFFTGISHSDYHEYAYFPDNHNQFLVGNDGGIYLHRWNDIFVVQDRNRGYNVTQFYGGSFHPDSVATLGGTQDNGTIRVKPAGQFSYIFGADGGYAHVHQQDPTIAYFSTQLDGLFKVNNWNDGVPVPVSIMFDPMSNEGVSFINAYEMNYADGDQLYYKTFTGVWRNLQQGNRNMWDRIGEETINSILRLSLSEETDPQLYFAGRSTSNENYLYRNMDARDSSDMRPFFTITGNEEMHNTSTIKIDVHPQNNDRILFSFYNYTSDLFPCWLIPNTRDEDPTAINVSGNLPEGLPVNVIKFHPHQPDSIFIAATDFGLYYTTDAGQTWQKEDRFPNVQIFDMRIRPKDGKVFLYTYGRGIWSATLTVEEPLPHTLPYVEDFESGSWDSGNTAGRTTNNGRVKVLQRDTLPRFHFLTMDMSSSADNQTGSCSFTVRIDPGDADAISLGYFYFLFGDSVELASTGVYIRSESQTEYQQWRSFQDLLIRPFGIDNLYYPVTTHETHYFKFLFEGQREIPVGGIAVDQITIQETDLATSTFDDKIASIEIYPNPATNNVQFKQLEDIRISDVELYDVGGSRLHSWKCTPNDIIRLDIPSSVPSGMYVLAFKNDKGLLGSRQLIIQ